MPVVQTVLVIIVIGVSWAGSSQAGPDLQGRRTRVPGGMVNTPVPANQRPTLDTSGAQATAWTVATSAAQAAEGIPGAAQTAEALLNYAAEASSNPDAIVATAEAYALQLAVDPAAVEAAVLAVLEEVPAEWYAETEIESDDLAVLLDTWLSGGNMDVWWEGEALYAAVSYTETGLNALLDSALLLYEYPVDDANVDLVPGGAIIDLYGVTTETAGTGNVRLHVLLTPTEDGRVAVDLVAASFNGRQVPAQMLDDIETLLVSLSDVWNGALVLVYGVTYEMSELVITAQDFTATVVVTGMAP